jgi:hypothetical protein
MSKERELLEHCRMHLSSIGMFVEHSALINNIDKLLAQPEPPQTAREMYQRGYAAAERDLKREPLNPEFRETISKAYGTKSEQKAFEEGIIFAEMSHEIGGKNE